MEAQGVLYPRLTFLVSTGDTGMLGSSLTPGVLAFGCLDLRPTAVEHGGRHVHLDCVNRIRRVDVSAGAPVL